MSRPPKKTSKVDLEDEIHSLCLELVEETQDNQALLEHLLASLQTVYGKQKPWKHKLTMGFGLTMV